MPRNTTTRKLIRKYRLRLLLKGKVRRVPKHRHKKVGYKRRYKASRKIRNRLRR